MSVEIGQGNLYLLIPSKVSWVADFIAVNKHTSIADAVRMFYCSNTYRKLEDETTKMWHLGPVAIYEELMEEWNNNKLNMKQL